MPLKIDEWGNRYWYNEKGQLHRENGPAIEWWTGHKWWYINDRMHRLDGPAIEMNDESSFWSLRGEIVKSIIIRKEINSA